MYKWVKDLNRHCSKEDRQVGNKYMKRCSTSPVIREMQIQTTVRYHFTPIGWLFSKDRNNECWQGYGKIGIRIHC